MTREERLKWLKQIEKDIHVCSLESTLADDMKSCAIHSAIEELEQIPELKEGYNKGYKDGQDAIAFHLELCKEEGSIIEIPEGATNGDMVKAVTHKEPLTDVFGIPYMTFTGEWWDAPYRKEK